MKITGAQAIVRALELEGVSIMFGYPGAAVCPLYDLLPQSGIKHILTRHEQNAAHAASGYARVTGKVGVCLATSGPGATNLITGIATAYMDSIPMVAITGQVSTDLIGKDVFQEVDIIGSTAPFTKHNYLVKKAKDIPRIIKEAFHIASTGRPGPVLIDIPVDLQMKEIVFEYPETVDIRGYKPNYKGHSVQIRKAVELIEEAKSPVICAGGGIINADASAELRAFSEKAGVPVISTLMGKGCMPYDHPNYLGMIGSHGVYAANNALHNADLIIIMGARVGDRSIGTGEKIQKSAKYIHIDIDPAEIGKNVPVTVPVVGEIKDILKEMTESITRGNVIEWNNYISKVKSDHPAFMCKLDFSSEKTVKPQYLIMTLSEMAGEDAIITTEVGQNQIWAAHYCKTVKPRTFITSGGMGTMGYGLPAAVGAKFGKPDERVILIAGDGSFQMNMQEFGTIKANHLGVKVVILNNSRLGMVREIQEFKYDANYSAVVLDANPDFVMLANAYGFKAERITSNSEVVDAVKRMLADDEPYVLEVIVDPNERTIC
jgi:acetolactate synthase I/II/III large subunit